MGKVASPLTIFRIGKVAEVLANSPYSAFSVAIGLVMVSGSHVKINLDVDHKLHSEGGGEIRISIRDNGSGKTVDREDSFDKDLTGFNSCDVLRNWNKVGQPSEAIQHNYD